MAKPADARLTPEISREICERTASAAVLDGSIASLGSQYVLRYAQRTAAAEMFWTRSRCRLQEKKMF